MRPGRASLHVKERGSTCHTEATRQRAKPFRFCGTHLVAKLEAREIGAGAAPAEVTLHAYSQPIEMAVVPGLESADEALDRRVSVQFAIWRWEIVEELRVAPAKATVGTAVKARPRTNERRKRRSLQEHRHVCCQGRRTSDQARHDRKSQTSRAPHPSPSPSIAKYPISDSQGYPHTIATRIFIQSCGYLATSDVDNFAVPMVPIAGRSGSSIVLWPEFSELDRAIRCDSRDLCRSAGEGPQALPPNGRPWRRPSGHRSRRRKRVLSIFFAGPESVVAHHFTSRDAAIFPELAA